MKLLSLKHQKKTENTVSFLVFKIRAHLHIWLEHRITRAVLGLCPGKGKRCTRSCTRHTNTGWRRGDATHCDIWRREEDSLCAPRSVNGPSESASETKPRGAAAAPRLGPSRSLPEAAARPRARPRRGVPGPEVRRRRQGRADARGEAPRGGAGRDRKAPEARPSLRSCGRGPGSVGPRAPGPLIRSSRRAP